EPGCEFGLRYGSGSVGQDHLEGFEDRLATGSFIFAPETGEDPIQQSQGPFALEEPLGGPGVGRFAQVTALGIAGVDGQHVTTAPANFRSILFALMGEEVGAVAQEKC